jgi:predicted transcriptional regulator
VEDAVPRREHRARGDLEREVIACLATAAEPLTPAEVLVKLDRPLAYTTVMTTLSRLHEKRALTRTPRGRAFAYALAGAIDGVQSNITAHQMHRLLDEGSDRASVLARFVADLSPADEQLLAELLAHPDEP